MARAKTHKDNGEYTNPEVRFERGDIDAGSIVRFGVVLGGVLLATAFLVTWLAVILTRMENRIKGTTLPPSAADADNALPPQPRLEGIEDVRDRVFEIYPPRARAYYADQIATLRDGNSKEGVERIADAIDQLAGRLPARKEPPPASFGVALPSKSSSGRVETGGQ